jgi:hypothetical protein
MIELQVYWAARNVRNRSTPLNHHFVLIAWKGTYALPPVRANIENGWQFITLGAYPSEQNGNIITRHYGNLVFTENDGFDIGAARMFLNSELRSFDVGNFDPKGQPIAPPQMSATGFAWRLTNMAFNYRRITLKNPIAYQLTGPNSNTWVNSLFNAAGVLHADRTRYRNFVGLDVAANELIPSIFFSY